MAESTPHADAPPSDDFALAARATPLTGVIAAELAAGGGRITFARFMALALGHWQHGYYSRERLDWGADGDYETSPEVHPIFGYLWARQVAECWERLGRPVRFDLVEVGAGSGRFAAALLTWLRERAPECAQAVRPLLLDGHRHRLAEQRRALEALEVDAEHALLDEWLDQTAPVTGVVVSNEFFDALPVHVVERRGETLHEWHVAAAADGGLRFELGPPSTPALAAHFARLGVQSGDGCRAEVSPAAVEVMARLSGRLERGYLISIDYGHEATDLYAPWRRMGTLMAFRHHSPQPDPARLAGAARPHRARRLHLARGRRSGLRGGAHGRAGGGAGRARPGRVAGGHAGARGTGLRSLRRRPPRGGDADRPRRPRPHPCAGAGEGRAAGWAPLPAAGAGVSGP